MIQIHANQTDNLAPHAYLGRISNVDTDTWTAAVTDWDITTTDQGPGSDHQILDIFIGVDAEQRAEQRVRDEYEAWKTRN